MDHPGKECIFRYVAREVGPGEQLEVDDHLAGCASCRERIGTLIWIRDHFDAIWPSWTANEHGRLYSRWRLARALRIACEKSPSVARRARQWFERLGRGTEVALKVLLDRSRRIASTAEAVLPPGLGFELRPAAAGVGSAEEQSRLEGHLKRGSELLKEDRPDEAIDALLEAVKIDARSPQAAMSYVLKQEFQVFQVVADSRRGRISIRVPYSKGQPHPGLALLLPQAEEDEARIVEFEPVEGEGFLLATFDRLSSGAYRVEIEPFIQGT